jgi:hypothetical protein
MDLLSEAGIPFLVGGGYALAVYTGIVRHTKDLDLFVHPADVSRTLECLRLSGYEVELTFPHWLGKAKLDAEKFIDIIFRSGNGVCEVDDEWFRYAVSGQVLERDVRLAPVEEMLWSKAFVMERERYDGADVAHLLLHCSDKFDWERLLRRFGAHWRLLYIHLVMFGFIFPDHRLQVPRHLMRDLSDRMMSEYEQPMELTSLCQGTLLSRAQYLCDIGPRGLVDARLQPEVGMDAKDVALWTAGIAVDGPEAKFEQHGASQNRGLRGAQA